MANGLFHDASNEHPWLWLALVLLISLPPMLVGLGQRDATHTMERVAMVTSQETWFRQQGRAGRPPEADAWLMPSFNGRPRVRKPPAIVWVNMLAWVGLDADQAPLQTLLWRSRLTAVAAAALMLVAVYWAGFTLGGSTLALLSALAVGTTWYFQRQARTASYDIHMAAWVTLSIASALWAMAPFAAPPGLARRAGGWLLASITLGLAVLIKGPLALAVTLPVLAAIIVLIGSDRRANLVSLGLAGLGALALAAPWYLYAQTQVPGALTQWVTEIEAERDEFQPPWYYLAVLGMIAPWTLWLVGGLLLPFLRGEAGAANGRRWLLTPWIWFALILLMFSIPAAKQQRYILPIMPAAGLLVGLMWAYHQRLAERGQRDPGAWRLCVPHWTGMILVSLAAGPLLLGQAAMVSFGWVEHLPIGPIRREVVIVGGVLLTAIAVIGAWLHYLWRPRGAAIATATWSALLLAMIWHAYSAAESGDLPVRESAAELRLRTDDHPLYCLTAAERDIRVDVGLLLYLRRNVPDLPLEQATRAQPRPGEVIYLLAPEGFAQDELDAAGWFPLEVYPLALSEPTRLWALPPR